MGKGFSELRKERTLKAFKDRFGVEASEQWNEFEGFLDSKDGNGFRRWVAGMDPKSEEALTFYAFTNACLGKNADWYRWVLWSLSVIRGFDEHIAGIHILNYQSNTPEEEREDVTLMESPWEAS